MMLNTTNNNSQTILLTRMTLTRHQNQQQSHKITICNIYILRMFQGYKYLIRTLTNKMRLMTKFGEK